MSRTRPDAIPSTRVRSWNRRKGLLKCLSWTARRNLPKTDSKTRRSGIEPLVQCKLLLESQRGVPRGVVARECCSRRFSVELLDFLQSIKGAQMMDIVLNHDRFKTILAALVDQTPKLQNNPPKHVPEEDRAAKIVLEALRPYSRDNGGPLRVEHLSYVPGRGNVIIEYPGSAQSTIGFVGSHFDVVPADPAGWERNPFKLAIE